MTHSIKRMPSCIYFSCSQDEYDSDNRYLKSEKPVIDALYNWFAEKGIPTDLVIEKGNHYENVVPRMADGIAWTLLH